MGRRDAVKFGEGRETQSDADFVRGCSLDRSRQGQRIALGVRRVIAKLGGVDAAVIYAQDRFDGPIASLPFLDSLDTVELIMEIEQEFDLTIPDEAAEKIRDPELAPFTVADFVADIYRVVAPKMANG